MSIYEKGMSVGEVVKRAAVEARAVTCYGTATEEEKIVILLAEILIALKER